LWLPVAVGAVKIVVVAVVQGVLELVRVFLLLLAQITQ
jgi:hypothetical protein